MALNCKDRDEIWGVVRNSVLIKTFLPEWTLRVFASKSSKSYLTRGILRKLQSANVSVYYVSDKLTESLPEDAWGYLAADDPRVEYFLIRNSKQRLGARDASSVKQWLSSDAAVYCTRDQPSHRNLPIVNGLWGARRHRLRTIFGMPIRSVLLDYFQKSTEHPKASVESFLTHSLWPLVQNDVFCPDSVSCNKWPGSSRLPPKTKPSQSLGLLYDRNEIIVSKDYISNAASSNSTIATGCLGQRNGG